MKHILSLLTVLLLPPLAALQAATVSLTKPNIVFFFVDDMGWLETSVPFHSEVTELNRRYRTPNMERLAAQGMKFTQAYASAVCSQCPDLQNGEGRAVSIIRRSPTRVLSEVLGLFGFGMV